MVSKFASDTVDHGAFSFGLHQADTDLLNFDRMVSQLVMRNPLSLDSSEGLKEAANAVLWAVDTVTEKGNVLTKDLKSVLPTKLTATTSATAR